MSEKVCGHIGDAWICMSKVGHDGDHRHENRPLEVVRCLDWIGRQLAQPDLRSEFLKEWTQEAEVAAEERGRRRGIEEMQLGTCRVYRHGCADGLAIENSVADRWREYALPHPKRENCLEWVALAPRDSGKEG